MDQNKDKFTHSNNKFLSENEGSDYYTTNKTNFLDSPSKQSKIGQKISNTFLNLNLNNDTTVEEEIITNDKKFIKLNIMIHNDKKPILKNITTEISRYVTARELIRECIVLFNKLFNEENLNIVLNTRTFESYQLKASKKNGKPDNDLPVLNKETAVFSTGLKSFSLVYLDQDLDKINKRVDIMKCRKCLIF